ncbi:MAG: DEAD/DEAH box helicase, partial [Candidatus Aenigmarchaeota archaeon]|nr:DEAD/DEAH box helicase [Candidatus Aenigmarchaeota archaeon]
MTFSEMNIDKQIMDAIRDMKIETPTEIQQKALPPALLGKDIVAMSMTGSGKTLVFAVPILQFVEHGKGVQALVLAPTRELANQISEQFRKLSRYKKARVCEVFGGVSIEPQIHELRTAEIVIGTPGRILDHMSRGTIHFGSLKILVLDEADRMLDMGFIDDIKDIIHSLPRKRQTMLFSATVPDEIYFIAKRYMVDPVKIAAQRHVEKHKLRQFYYDVKSEYKLSLLQHLIEKESPSLAIVFCSTRTTTDIVARHLEQAGVEARAIHGGLTQARRTNVLEGFHRGRPHILVATDVAARGLDIKNVSHIFNFDIPKTADEYTHRIGRTARIGKEGKAISLLSAHDHEPFRKIFGRFEIEKLRA